MRTAVLAILAFLLAPAALADVITLRSAARAPEAGGPITLGMVADLAGPEAQKMADTVLVADAVKDAGGAGVVKIDIARVRAALDAARISWARVQLSGAQVIVRVVAPKPDEKPSAAPPPAPKEAQVVELGGPLTVRQSAALTLAALFGCDLADMRVLFDPGDEAILAIREDGRRIETAALASDRSPRVPVAVTIYDGDKIALSTTIRTDVLLARDGVVVRKAVRKGGSVDSDDVGAERVWVNPGFEPAALRDVVGATARVRMAPGQVVRGEDLETPLVVRKGDIVTVHCVSGGVVVKTPARAMADARLGETVDCRVERSKKTFKARADAKGRVVMDLTSAPDPSIGPVASGGLVTPGTEEAR